MKIKPNQEGQALVMVIFFAAIAMLMILALMYMVYRGTAMSRVQKQYQTALDAGYAGVGISTGFLDSGLYLQIPSSTTKPVYTTPSASSTGASITFPAVGTLQIQNNDSTKCFYNKIFTTLNIAINTWAAPCGANDSTIDPTQLPDIRYAVAGVNTSYYVYTKIVDSRRGLTAQRPPGGLEVARGFSNRTQAQGLSITPQAYFYYTVEVEAQNVKSNGATAETAQISFDYAY
jgi:DNA-binding transcriptional regulator of glucitol operon